MNANLLKTMASNDQLLATCRDRVLTLTPVEHAAMLETITVLIKSGNTSFELLARIAAGCISAWLYDDKEESTV
jgi:hypothetical protein